MCEGKMGEKEREMRVEEVGEKEVGGGGRLGRREEQRRVSVTSR